MGNKDLVVSFLVRELNAITGKPAGDFSEETRLIGQDAVIGSRELVELLLALEDFCEQSLQVHFDWTNDSAMSEARSAYRTVGTMAEHIIGLQVS